MDKKEKLERMREELKRDKERLVKLQANIKAKENKLKETEAAYMLAEIAELSLTPESLSEYLKLIRVGKIEETVEVYGNSNAASEEPIDDMEEEENED